MRRVRLDQRELHEAFTLPSGSIVVAAHPEDETIGLGATMASSEKLTVLYLTTVCPGDHVWRAPLIAPADELCSDPHEELRCAMKLAGVDPQRVRSLRIGEAAATETLVSLTRSMIDEIQRIAPPVVITHAYEGGHPDHDAVAFIVHAAAAMLEREGNRVPVVAEMTSWHARDGELVTYEFLPSRMPVYTRVLTASEKELKRAMIECYVTRREVLAAFPLQVERVRLAPAYAFTEAPHTGTLWYELRGWMQAAEWREHALRALLELGFEKDARL
jgi:LmbE family N-acetylglucosaminyl deacetylase